MRALAKLPVLDAWNAVADDQLVSFAQAHDLADALQKVGAKALGNTSARFAAKSTVRAQDGGLRFTAAPPVLSEVPDATAAAVAAALGPYVGTVPAELHPLLARYRVQDVAFRVVGTGSVGTRSYVVLLTDHREQPLVLQVKEARPSVLLPHLARAGYPVTAPEGHEGRRVVLGQKRMQVVSDTLLGWTTVDGLPYQVRQFRNRKGSVDPAALLPAQLDDYARITGALLARAHAHTADPGLITGYCGKNEELDEAVATFAVAYADRTEADHADLVTAVRAGRPPGRARRLIPGPAPPRSPGAAPRSPLSAGRGPGTARRPRRTPCGRVWWTRCPASTVTTRQSGIRPAISAIRSCGTWLARPPATTRVGAVIAAIRSSQTGSGVSSCALTGFTTAQSKSTGPGARRPPGPCGRG